LYVVALVSKTLFPGIGGKQHSHSTTAGGVQVQKLMPLKTKLVKKQRG